MGECESCPDLGERCRSPKFPMVRHPRGSCARVRALREEAAERGCVHGATARCQRISRLAVTRTWLGAVTEVMRTWVTARLGASRRACVIPIHATSTHRSCQERRRVSAGRSLYGSPPSSLRSTAEQPPMAATRASATTSSRGLLTSTSSLYPHGHTRRTPPTSWSCLWVHDDPPLDTEKLPVCLAAKGSSSRRYQPQDRSRSRVRRCFVLTSVRRNPDSGMYQIASAWRVAITRLQLRDRRGSR